MDSEKILSAVAGFLVAAVLAGLVFFLARRARGSSACGAPKYDERQQAARGAAYKAAFFTLSGYLVAAGLFDLLTGIVWCDRLTGSFLGICLALTVFVGISIWRDAYVSMQEGTKSTVLLLSLTGGVNLAIGLINLVSGTLVEDGALTFRSMNLLLGLAMLAMLAVFLLKHLRDRRSAEAEQ